MRILIRQVFKSIVKRSQDDGYASTTMCTRINKKSCSTLKRLNQE